MCLVLAWGGTSASTRPSFQFFSFPFLSFPPFLTCVGSCGGGVKSLGGGGVGITGLGGGTVDGDVVGASGERLAWVVGSLVVSVGEGGLGQSVDCCPGPVVFGGVEG